MYNTNHMVIVLIIHINISGYRQKAIWDSLVPPFEYDEVENIFIARSPKGQKVTCYLNDILETTVQTQAKPSL